MWYMTGTHTLLQSSGVKSGTALDLVLSLAVLNIPRQMVKQRAQDYKKRYFDKYSRL